MLRIGVVTAFAEQDWHSARLIRAVEERGADAVVIDPASFALGLSGRGLDVHAGEVGMLELDALLLARGLSPRGDGELQFETYRQLLALGQPQVNSIGALLTAQDKLRASCFFARAGVPTPETRIVQSEAEAAAALADFGVAVVKPRFGSLGEGMFRLRDDADGRAQMAGLLADGEGSVYVQRYVETGGEDFRVYVVGNRACGAIRRRARAGEWRTNFAQGGASSPCDVTPEMARVAVAAARSVGLTYTAVDVVQTPNGVQVLEVNGHPNFEIIWDVSGIDVGGKVADHVLKLARAWRKARARLPQRNDPTWAAMAPSA